MCVSPDEPSRPKKIDPKFDETREYLIANLAYAQSLGKLGYVNGVGSATYDRPRGHLTGDPYSTDGRRVVMCIADQSTNFDETKMLKLSSSAQEA